MTSSHRKQNSTDAKQELFHKPVNRSRFDMKDKQNQRFNQNYLTG